MNANEEVKQLEENQAEQKANAIKYLNGEEVHARESLVCIANVESGEVIRIPREVAFLEYIYKKDSRWFFTHKTIYKQYLDSLKPGSDVPRPVFVKTDKEGEQYLANVFIGRASVRRSKKKSSTNKKGKHFYQHIEANTVKQGKEEIYRPARTIRHAKY